MRRCPPRSSSGRATGTGLPSAKASGSKPSSVSRSPASGATARSASRAIAARPARSSAWASVSTPRPTPSRRASRSRNSSMASASALEAAPARLARPMKVRGVVGGRPLPAARSSSPSDQPVSWSLRSRVASHSTYRGSHGWRHWAAATGEASTPSCSEWPRRSTTSPTWAAHRAVEDELGADPSRGLVDRMPLGRRHRHDALDRGRVGEGGLLQELVALWWDAAVAEGRHQVPADHDATDRLHRLTGQPAGQGVAVLEPPVVAVPQRPSRAEQDQGRVGGLPVPRPRPGDGLDDPAGRRYGRPDVAGATGTLDNGLVDGAGAHLLDQAVVAGEEVERHHLRAARSGREAGCPRAAPGWADLVRHRAGLVADDPLHHRRSGIGQRDERPLVAGGVECAPVVGDRGVLEEAMGERRQEQLLVVVVGQHRGRGVGHGRPQRQGHRGRLGAAVGGLVLADHAEHRAVVERLAGMGGEHRLDDLEGGVEHEVGEVDHVGGDHPHVAGPAPGRHHERAGAVDPLGRLGGGRGHRAVVDVPRQVIEDGVVGRRGHRAVERIELGHRVPTDHDVAEHRPGAGALERVVEAEAADGAVVDGRPRRVAAAARVEVGRRDHVVARGQCRFGLPGRQRRHHRRGRLDDPRGQRPPEPERRRRAEAGDQPPVGQRPEPEVARGLVAAQVRIGLGQAVGERPVQVHAGRQGFAVGERGWHPATAVVRVEAAGPYVGPRLVAGRGHDEGLEVDRDQQPGIAGHERVEGDDGIEIDGDAVEQVPLRPDHHIAPRDVAHV